MGYTTTFDGKIFVEPPLNEDEVSFLKDFSRTRHYIHNDGPLRIDVEDRGGPGVVDYNTPQYTQPALWFSWEATPNGDAIQWDGSEKARANIEWIRYIIGNLFSPNGRAYVQRYGTGDKRLENFTFDHVFNGSVEAMGEDVGDYWMLNVENNYVSKILPSFP